MKLKVIISIFALTMVMLAQTAVPPVAADSSKAAACACCQDMAKGHSCADCCKGDKCQNNHSKVGDIAQDAKHCSGMAEGKSCMDATNAEGQKCDTKKGHCAEMAKHDGKCCHSHSGTDHAGK
jgi:hypothetical protein